MLNATWLDTFVTLCDTGQFTRAAERLNMTQPGVSQHLRKLEQQVGQPLLSRDGQSFVPTPAGKAVLDLGRRRRTQEEDLRRALSKDDPNTGDAFIACSGSLGLLLYPHLIDLMRDTPGLHVHLEAAPQIRVMQGVLEGDFDLGIVDHRPGHPRLEGVSMGYDQLRLVLPADADPAPDFAALQSLGYISHPDGAAYADDLLGANFPEDYRGADRLRLRSHINQIGQIAAPVAQGVGYTILPQSGIDAYPASERLQLIDLAEPVHQHLWLIQRKARQLPAQTRRLRQVILDVIAATSPT